jgi:four helix bundle protein
MKVHDFTELDLWNVALELEGQVWDILRNTPLKADFALRDALNASIVSVTSNIGEGFARGSDRAFAQYLCVARGSTGEVRAQLIVASRRGHIPPGRQQRINLTAVRTGKMLTSLISYLYACDSRNRHTRHARRLQHLERRQPDPRDQSDQSDQSDQ